MSETYSQAQSIFRTAAIFYGNDPANYGSTNNRNIRKLVESALYHSNDRGMSIQEISEYIIANFLIDIESSEIANVINDRRYIENFVHLTDSQTPRFVLSKKRYLSIESSQTSKNLNDFIDEYILHEKLTQGAKEIIIQYLYGLFTSNIESFRRLFQLKRAASLAIEINREYSDVETAYINGFLLWDNSDKDQAIFNFASYALEYCMITNRKDSSNINEQLGLKEFYVDTNIIYRAIGLNGIDRKRRTLQLLDKLLATKCKLLITTESKKELLNSLKDKFDRLRKDHNPAVKSQIFQEFVTYDDIYSAYHRWCVGKVNTSVDLFEAFINSEFDNLRVKYSIQTDGDCPYIKEEKEDLLEKMSIDIKSFSRRKTNSMSLRDATNVLWVESKRMPNQLSVFSAKHFLLSSDKGLRYWDIVRNDGNNPRIIIHPSEWLSLILRYSHRTADDFKSFISFLTLRSGDSPMSNEELNIAICSIAEIAESIDIQKTTCENLLRISFERSGKTLTNDSIRELAKVEAERELEKRLSQAEENNHKMSKSVESLSNENSSLKDTLELQKGKAQEIINSVISEKEAIQHRLTEAESVSKNKIAELEGKLRQSESQREKEREDYKKSEANRVTNNWIIGRIIISVILIILMFFYLFASKDGDFLFSIKVWIKSHEDISSVVDGWLPVLLGGIAAVIFPWKLLLRKIFSKSYACGAFE